MNAWPTGSIVWPSRQIGPDVGDDCPVCVEQAERQAVDVAIYESGYMAAQEDLDHEEDRW